MASCAKKTPQTQLQPITHLLNEQGKLAGQGWSINSPKIINNQELAISHYDSVGVSALMKRNCNFFLIKAHNAQITMAVPMQLGGICISKLSWFDVELGPATEKVIESWVCPEMSPEDTYTFASNGIRLIDGDLSIVIQPDS